eukprot:501154_1
MDRLLVDGYVREIDKTLLNTMIIPVDIYHICFDFYFSSKFIFYLASLNTLQDHLDQSFKSEITNSMIVANIDTKKQYNCNVYKLCDHKTNILNSMKHHTEWTIDCGGIQFTRNLKLPNIIQSKLHYPKNKFNNIIFTLGGFTKIHESDSNMGSTDCSALIANSHQFSENKTEIINIYKWDLPTFPINICYNYILYSYTQKALFNIGGADGRHVGQDYNTIHKLTFDCNNETYINCNKNEWKWNELNVKLNERKGNVCCSCIDNGNKLMICGGCSGHTHLNSVEIFDFNCNKMINNIKKLNNVRMDAGIYYDMVNNIVYVGGGFNNSGKSKQSVEYYDFKKNIWYNMPNTNLQHDMNPMIWIENNNLLHIMSVQSNGIEFIDLRESKKWETSVNDLEKIFKTEFVLDTITCSRIVGN